jgi:hypothetical protein
MGICARLEVVDDVLNGPTADALARVGRDVRRVPVLQQALRHALPVLIAALSHTSSRFDISGWRDGGHYPVVQGRRGARGESRKTRTTAEQSPLRKHCLQKSLLPKDGFASAMERAATLSFTVRRWCKLWRRLFSHPLPAPINSAVPENETTPTTFLAPNRGMESGRSIRLLLHAQQGRACFNRLSSITSRQPHGQIIRPPKDERLLRPDRVLPVEVCQEIRLPERCG